MGDPIYTGITAGLFDATKNIMKGLVEKSRKGKAKEYFYSALENIQRLSKPTEERYVDPEKLTPIDANDFEMLGEQGEDYDVVDEPVKVDKKALGDAYIKGVTGLYDFTDVMPKGPELLGAYYDLMSPVDKKLYKVKDKILSIDPESGDYDVLYSEPEELEEPTTKGAYKTKIGDKYYLVKDIYDQESKGFKQTILRELNEYEVRDMEIEREGDELSLDQKEKRLRTSPRGRIKTPTVEDPSPQENLRKKDIDKYATFKAQDWGKLTKKERQEFQELHDRIQDVYGQDPDELTNYIYDKKLSKKRKDAAEYSEFVNQRQELIDDQYNQLLDAYNAAVTKYENGQMSWEALTNYLTKLREDNEPLLYPEVRQRIADLFTW